MKRQEESTDMIWRVREIKESSEELLALLEQKDWYIPRINQMVSENRKKEWLAVRVLMKELLGEEKEILYTTTGKPYLKDDSFYVSMSHTKGYVAVVLSKCNSVGIDIEYVSSRIQKISSRFMSESELAGISKECEDIHLLLHWSAKESLFKALSEENVDFRECLHIDTFIPQLNVLSSFSGHESRTDTGHSFIVNYMVKDDYVLTFTSLKSVELKIKN
jgi:phosphopantetheinyl transferase